MIDFTAVTVVVYAAILWANGMPPWRWSLLAFTGAGAAGLLGLLLSLEVAPL